MLLLFHGETKSSVEIQATKLTCAQQVREWAPFHFSFVCGMKDKPRAKFTRVSSKGMIHSNRNPRVQSSLVSQTFAPFFGNVRFQKVCQYLTRPEIAYL